jgi:hypothetical protein
LALMVAPALERRQIRREVHLWARALRIYGPRWLGLWSAEDEAINGLRASLHLSGEVVPRREAPVAFSEVYRVVSNPPQNVYLDSGLRFPVFSAGTTVWIFESMFGWAYRLPYNKLFAPQADKFILRQVSKAVQGNNRPATRISGVDRHPSALLSSLAGLPHSINEAVCNLANESGREAIPRIRQSLGEAKFGAAISGSQNPLYGAISGNELVHTSYFRSEELIDLVCTHIRLTSGSAESLSSNSSLGSWDEWVREYKANVANSLR